MNSAYTPYIKNDVKCINVKLTFIQQSGTKSNLDI
jgi:hypothetical protein